MKCPNDQTVLALSYRSGVEIDYCPECRGVWLDRGELDKLVAVTDHEPSQDNYRHDREQRDYSDDSRHRQPPQHKKREGFLGDLFDF